MPVAIWYQLNNNIHRIKQILLVCIRLGFTLYKFILALLLYNGCKRWEIIPGLCLYTFG